MKSELSHIRQRLRRRKSDTRELSARLAPLEEQRPAADVPGVSIPSSGAELVTQQKGAIVVGNHQPNLPKDLMEVDAHRGFLGVEPVVMLIVGLMLAFIIFIAWQISRM